MEMKPEYLQASELAFLMTKTGTTIEKAVDWTCKKMNLDKDPLYEMVVELAIGTDPSYPYSSPERISVGAAIDLLEKAVEFRASNRAFEIEGYGEVPPTYVINATKRFIIREHSLN